MSAPIALDGVSVRLGGTTILDHLSLEIAAGSWVGSRLRPSSLRHRHISCNEKPRHYVRSTGGSWGA